MRIFVLLVSSAFAVYAAFQSWTIAQAGVTYQIPQLEGDGGAGFVFAVICLLAAILVFFRPLVSLGFYILAALGIAFVAFEFQDRIEFSWSLGAIVLGALTIYIRYRSRLTSKA